MLAIGRALMSNPKFLMLDEPSLGIAPRLISTIFEKIVEINKTQGITILLVEQNANLALEISSYAYALETGHIVMEGESKKLHADPRLKSHVSRRVSHSNPLVSLRAPPVIGAYVRHTKRAPARWPTARPAAESIPPNPGLRPTVRSAAPYRRNHGGRM